MRYKHRGGPAAFPLFFGHFRPRQNSQNNSLDHLPRLSRKLNIRAWRATVASRKGKRENTMTTVKTITDRVLDEIKACSTGIETGCITARVFGARHCTPNWLFHRRQVQGALATLRRKNLAYGMDGVWYAK